MFAIHQRDPRKTVFKALETADRLSRHSCGRDPKNSDPADRACRLYDLSIVIHELHENLVGQGINLDELDHAREIVRRVDEELLYRHPEIKPQGRVALATWSLNALLEGAAGRKTA